MYLVDTSVWIHALRPAGHPEIQARLKPLIIDGHTAVTEPVMSSRIIGLVQSEQPSSLLQWFAPVNRLPFHPHWWEPSDMRPDVFENAGCLPQLRIASSPPLQPSTTSR